MRNASTVKEAPVVPRPEDPPITPELVAEHGLNTDEWEQIVALMGRVPTFTELGVFSAMWSEHCGYKNSRPLLRTLPTDGEHVVQGPGENAGVIDVGDGWGVAFKIESHNHPSAVEPYQGAATGAGGILRDVFTMGARPIALFDSLHFGSLDSPQARYLFDGVVRGVGDYGNCVGVPTVGGEAIFDPAYEKNPLINVMCVGVLPLERLIRGEAHGVGNPVMAVGARTGRDGIHGATFASEELNEESLDSRPQVQVGDPFTEKLLLEASLELIERNLLVGIQDMGAAGLTSSGTEMAARSGSGIDIDVALLPVRESGMTPYEMLLSESQERMLLVARPEYENEVREVLSRWDLQAATIGTVTDDGMFRVREDGITRVEIPVLPLVDDCPVYLRDGIEGGAARAARTADVSAYAELGSDSEVAAAFLALLDAPAVASRRWIYEQYDTTVQTRTLQGPGFGAAVLQLPAGSSALAVTTDGNGRHTYLSPRTGGRAGVAEAARNVACTGARPLAITNCLNFGNPERAEIYYQLAGAVQGMGEACRRLGTPVTGGNVSLYNETGGSPVHPTPVVGMVGLIDDYSHRVPTGFSSAGDEIWVAGETKSEIGGSEYLFSVHGVTAGEPPKVDLNLASTLVEFLVTGARKRLWVSANDGSDGGLSVAIAESALQAGGGPVGFTVDLGAAPGATSGANDLPDADDLPAAALWFGETHSRVVLSCRPGSRGIERLAHECGVPVARVGTVGERDGTATITCPQHVFSARVAELVNVYESAIPRRMRDQAGLTS